MEFQTQWLKNIESMYDNIVKQVHDYVFSQEHDYIKVFKQEDIDVPSNGKHLTWINKWNLLPNYQKASVPHQTILCAKFAEEIFSRSAAETCTIAISSQS